MKGTGLWEIRHFPTPFSTGFDTGDRSIKIRALALVPAFGGVIHGMHPVLSMYFQLTPNVEATL